MSIEIADNRRCEQSHWSFLSLTPDRFCRRVIADFDRSGSESTERSGEGVTIEEEERLVEDRHALTENEILRFHVANPLLFTLVNEEIDKRF